MATNRTSDSVRFNYSVLGSILCALHLFMFCVLQICAACCAVCAGLWTVEPDSTCDQNNVEIDFRILQDYLYVLYGECLYGLELGSLISLSSTLSNSSSFSLSLSRIDRSIAEVLCSALHYLALPYPTLPYPTLAALLCTALLCISLTVLFDRPLDYSAFS